MANGVDELNVQDASNEEIKHLTGIALAGAVFELDGRTIEDIDSDSTSDANNSGSEIAKHVSVIFRDDVVKTTDVIGPNALSIEAFGKEELDRKEAMKNKQKEDRGE